MSFHEEYYLHPCQKLYKYASEKNGSEFWAHNPLRACIDQLEHEGLQTHTETQICHQGEQHS